MTALPTRPPAPTRDELRLLLADAREGLRDADAALVMGLGALRVLLRRPRPEAAERELLRVAMRGGVDLGGEPPLTGARLAVWRLWRLWGLGVDDRGRFPARRPAGSARERWARVRELAQGAERVEANLLDGAPPDDELVAVDVAERELQRFLGEGSRGHAERALLAWSAASGQPAPDVCTGPRRVVWGVLDALREEPGSVPAEAVRDLVRDLGGADAVSELDLVRKLVEAHEIYAGVR